MDIHRSRRLQPTSCQLARSAASGRLVQSCRPMLVVQMIRFFCAIFLGRQHLSLFDESLIAPGTSVVVQQLVLGPT